MTSSLTGIPTLFIAKETLTSSTLTDQPDCSWKGYFDAGVAAIADRMIKENTSNEVIKKTIVNALTKTGFLSDSVLSEEMKKIASFTEGWIEHRRQCLEASKQPFSRNNEERGLGGLEVFSEDGSPSFSILYSIPSPERVIYNAGKAVINAACKSCSLMERACQSIEKSLPEMLKTKRALILTTGIDPNGAFALSFRNFKQTMTFLDLERLYDVKYRIVNDITSLCHAIDRETVEGGPIDLLVIRAHGNQEGVQLDTFDRFDIQTSLPTRSCLQSLSSNATIILDSCSVGKGKEEAQNFANFISLNSPPSTRIFAPIEPTTRFFVSKYNPINVVFLNEISRKSNITYRIDVDNKQITNRTFKITNLSELDPAGFEDNDLMNQAASPQRSIASYVNKEQIATPSINLPLEEMAQKIIHFAGNLSGVNQALDQMKKLGECYTNICKNPSNASQLLKEEMIRHPKEKVDRIMKAPKELIAKKDAFLADPNLSNGLDVIATAYTVMNVANEVLPALASISQTALHKPLKVPQVLAKEVLHLFPMFEAGFQVAIHKPLKVPEVLGRELLRPIQTVAGLATGMIENPLKTGEKIIRNILLDPPRALWRNVKGLFGGGKKAKRRSQEFARMQAVMKKRQEEKRLQMERAFAIAASECYKAAGSRRMLKPGSSEDSYSSELVEDWKQAHVRGIFSGDCVIFTQTIATLLLEDRFSEVAYLSARAHNPQPIIPPALISSVIELAVTTSQYVEAYEHFEKEVSDSQIVAKERQNEINALAEERKEHQEALQQLTEERRKLETLVKTDGARIAHNLQSKLAAKGVSKESLLASLNY